MQETKRDTKRVLPYLVKAGGEHEAAEGKNRGKFLQEKLEYAYKRLEEKRRVRSFFKQGLKKSWVLMFVLSCY